MQSAETASGSLCGCPASLHKHIFFFDVTCVIC